MISLCIATYNRLNYFKKAMDSVFEGFKDIDYPYEIVVADGGSTDGTLEYLRNLDNINLIEQGKLTGAIKAYNETFQKAKGDYILGFNDDMVIFPEVLVNSCKLMDNDEQIGIIGPKTQETKYGNLHNMFLQIIPYWMILPKMHIFRAAVLKETNYFDPHFRSYYIDIDCPLKVLKKGYTILTTRDVGIIHYRLHDGDVNIAKATNIKKLQTDSEFEYFQKKWKPLERSIEKYLNNSPFRRRKSYFFKRFCSKIYHSTGLRPFIENHNLLSMSMYDWFLEQTIMFKDKKYDNLNDFFLAQKYPDEIISSIS